MIRIDIDVVWTKIFGLNDIGNEDIKMKLIEELRFHPVNYFFSPKYQNKIVIKNIMLKEDVLLPDKSVIKKGTIPKETIREWDGYVTLLINKGYMCLCLSGLVPRIINILKENAVEYKINKLYNNDNVEIKDIPLNGIELRDYQIEQVEICKKKKRGIIHAATGAGKGLIIFKLAADIQLKTLIIVNRVTLFRQLLSRFKESLGLKDNEINTISGDDKYYNPANRITIATFQSLFVEEKGKGKKVILKHEEVLRGAEALHIDECFEESTRILTEDGPKCIKDIYNQKYNGKVWSYNIKTKKSELKKITNWFRKESNKLIKIKIFGDFNINCTPNHPIYTENFKKVRADKLKIGNKIIVKSDVFKKKETVACNMNEIQKQVFIGTILGDAGLCINSKGKNDKINKNKMARLRLVHGYKQKEYLKYKIDLLKNLFRNHNKLNWSYSPYGLLNNKYKKVYNKQSISGYELKEYFNKIYINNKKSIKNIINDITVISLAFWFMDDAYLCICKNKHGKNKIWGSYQLSSHGFTRKENLKILKVLKKKFKIEGNLKYEKRCKKYFLGFNKENSKIISKIISPYVIKSMQYKIWPEHRKKCNFKIKNFLNYSTLPIKSIKKIKYNPQRYYNYKNKNEWIDCKHKYVYNIEVDDNHNYFIGDGMLVGNCHHISTNVLGTILKYCKNAKVRIGYSATPRREDGYDLMLETHIGPIIHHVGISELIKKGYLSKPKIYMLKSPYYLDEDLSYPAAYKKFINNDDKNKLIAEIAYKFGKIGKSVLISFARVEYLKIIEKILKEINTAGLTIKKIIGANTADQKEEAIEKLNSKEYNIVLSTLFGEGVDVPKLDCLINCRNAKGQNDCTQQTGRVLRISKDKHPIIVDFMDYNTFNGTKTTSQNIFDIGEVDGDEIDEDMDVKDYFKSYSRVRLKIYKSEPEFEVREINNINEIEEINLK